MPLEFAEFAHYYQGQGLSDQQQRAKFEPFADFMECLTRAYWPHGIGGNPLGIGGDAGVEEHVGGQRDDCLSVLWAQYLERAVRGKKKSASEIERIGKKFILPRFGDRLTDTITRAEVTALVEDITYRDPT